LFTIERARSDERGAAFRLVFQHLAEEDRNNRVANALSLVASGELDPQGIFVVRAQGMLQGVLVCLPLRGASGLVWPPHVRPATDATERENQLVRTACAWLRSKGAKLAQSILASAEAPQAEPLLRNGFSHITRLHYLRHDLDEPCPDPPLNLTFQTYKPSNRQLFHDTLLRTYNGTHDCPELNGVRSVEEIIDGHKAQGQFNPERWWLVFSGRQPVGVMLTVEIPEWHGWDIAYVGVVPESRRQGFGRALTQLALSEAKAAGATGVTVAVDCRNQPAWNLYASMGFEPGDTREVYLAFLTPARG
jgi:ribosomal protein S18 acetylase RimI-like enzyme